jgi:hypothetical protein
MIASTPFWLESIRRLLTVVDVVGLDAYSQIVNEFAISFHRTRPPRRTRMPNSQATRRTKKSNKPGPITNTGKERSIPAKATE